MPESASAQVVIGPGVVRKLRQDDLHAWLPSPISNMGTQTLQDALSPIPDHHASKPKRGNYVAGKAGNNPAGVASPLL